MLAHTTSGRIGVLQLHIYIYKYTQRCIYGYFSNKGQDIHNPQLAHSGPGELDTNCVCLNNQPIHKIKSGCQILLHRFQSFISARRVFIPQLRGGRSVKTYNKTCLSQPEGAAHPIKKHLEFSGELWLMDSLSEFYKAFPPRQQLRSEGNGIFMGA